MECYVIEIATGDPKIERKGINECKTLNEAEGNFHKKIGNAKLSDQYESDLVIVVTSDGSVYRSEAYKKAGSTIEEKYYVVKIAKGDTEIAGKGIYEYATLNEAEGNFHRQIGTAKLSELYDYELAMVISSDGNIYGTEVHKKEVVIDEK